MTTSIRHPHGRTAAEARLVIQDAVRKRGLERHVSWLGYECQATVRPLVTVKGRVSWSHIEVEVSGLLSGRVAREIRRLLQERFQQ